MSGTAWPAQSGTGPQLRHEWWEVLGARLAGSRVLQRLRPLRVLATWAALVVVLIAAVAWPTMRVALGAWIGCLWAVVAWFLLRKHTREMVS